MQRRKYAKHIFKNLNEILHDFETKITTEARLMCEALKPAIDYLNDQNVNRLINVSKVLKMNGLDCKMINKLILFINKSLGKPKLSSRQNKKFNASYQNLMFTSFLVEFPDETYQLIKKFVMDNNIPTDDFLIQQIKQRVQNKLYSNVVKPQAIIPIKISEPTKIFSKPICIEEASAEPLPFKGNENHFHGFNNEEIDDDLCEENDFEFRLSDYFFM